MCDVNQANINAGRGVVNCEFPLPGHGFADYLMDGKAVGVIEAKKAGTTLIGVGIQYPGVISGSDHSSCLYKWELSSESE